MFGQMMGRKADPDVQPRGFLGITVEEKDETVRVKSVLAGSPAAQAGLKAGDWITGLGGKSVQNASDLLKASAKVAKGETVTLMIDRAGDVKQIDIKTGEGL